jgi:hypothetical protein
MTDTDHVCWHVRPSFGKNQKAWTCHFRAQYEYSCYLTIFVLKLDYFTE